MAGSRCESSSLAVSGERLLIAALSMYAASRCRRPPPQRSAVLLLCGLYGGRERERNWHCAI